jgi:hypothetical protein
LRSLRRRDRRGEPSVSTPTTPRLDRQSAGTTHQTDIQSGYLIGVYPNYRNRCSVPFAHSSFVRHTRPVNSQSKAAHRVYMSFMHRDGWRVSFLEADCQTSLPLVLRFATEDKIRTMHDRCGSGILEDRQGLEMGFPMGRGGAWLSLT